MKYLKTLLALGLIILLGSSISMASSNLEIILDGENVTTLATPIIKDGRTLIPIRSILEKMGAKVDWYGDTRTIIVSKDNKVVTLKVDSRLIKYRDGKEIYALSDVAPVLVGDKSYAPLRLITNAIGVDIQWDGSTNTVKIDSQTKSVFSSFFVEEILNIEDGQTIGGTTILKLNVSEEAAKNGAEIKYMLLDPDTAAGKVIARGKDIEGQYNWIPYVSDHGKKALVAAIYDDEGNFISGDAKLVNISIVPEVKLTGLSEIVSENAAIGVESNFVPIHVQYEITHVDKDKTITTGELDPWGTYNWSPMVDDNGNYKIRAIAYDENEKAYFSETKEIILEMPYILGLSGVKEGMILDKPVTLLANRNFNVLDTEYLIRYPVFGEERSLSKQGYGSYKWFPGPEDKGEVEVFARVTNTKGIVHQTKGIPVVLPGRPILLLEGVGPNQVITSEVEIRSSSNFGLEEVQYMLTNPAKGTKKLLAVSDPSRESYIFVPTRDDLEYSHIKAVGKYKENTIESEEIPIKIYLDTLYGPKPIVEKDKFMGVVSELARKSWEDTGMSAALQTAQAILETGWGQSVPVDKYTGRFSNNLFGIKGKGSAGSVTSNTWEEYNGTTFRIDADFRAYNSIDESWLNHKELLLQAERYGIFRDVMYDSTMGAWALRRAGYATDSQYPKKLMNIINLYNLDQLDKVNI
ncbi:MAG: stalk domain-containing protein [Tissierellaceae bacterium]|nr:stalk domain-containing protein [Tissierellaceae bacterium]